MSNMTMVHSIDLAASRFGFKLLPTASLPERTVQLDGAIDSDSATQFVEQLRQAASRSHVIDITINSPGGSIEDALWIIDAMNELTRNRHTLSTHLSGGLLGGAALLIAANGSVGHRTMAPDSHITLSPVTQACFGKPNLKTIDRLQHLNTRMLDTLETLSHGLTTRHTLESNLNAGLSQAWELTAEQTLYHGWVDRITITPN